MSDEERRNMILKWKRTPDINPRTNRKIKPDAQIYRSLIAEAEELGISPPKSAIVSYPNTQSVIHGCPKTNYSLDPSIFLGNAATRKRLQIAQELINLPQKEKQYITNLYKNFGLCDAPLHFRTKGMNEEDYIPLLIQYQRRRYGSGVIYDGNLAISLKQQRVYVDGAHSFEDSIAHVKTYKPSIYVMYCMFPMHGSTWHQNMLFVIHGERIIRCEPYTEDVQEKWNKKYDTIMNAFCADYGFKYEGVMFSNQKTTKFQSIESKFGKCHWDVGGYCVPWSMFIAEILLHRTITSKQRPFSSKQSLEKYISYVTYHPLWSQPWFLRKLMLDFLYTQTIFMYNDRITSPTLKPKYKQFISTHITSPSS